MNIDNWPLDRIMRLPDWCFGRRWWIGTHCIEAGGDIGYFMAEEQLPDKAVVWRVMISPTNPAPVYPVRVTIRLGDRVPVSAAEALTMDRVFKGISNPGQLYEFFVSQWDLTWMDCSRMLVESAGRRIVVVMIGDGVNQYEATVAVQISALPKEVPDWLISGSGKNLL